MYSALLDENEMNAPERLPSENVVTENSTKSLRSDCETDSAIASQVLAQVLGETLARRSEDVQGLSRSLVQWRTRRVETQFDRETCCDMVGHVLVYRLGTACGSQVVLRLRNEIGGVLWELSLIHI